MKCPVCRAETRVIDTRHRRGSTTRRRVCAGACGYRFTTREIIAGAGIKALRDLASKLADLGAAIEAARAALAATIEPEEVDETDDA